MGQTWKEFCSGLNKVAGKAAVKIEELSDSASLHIKVKTLDVKLCEAYEQLGRLFYRQMNGTVGLADEIETRTGEIDRLRQEIEDVKAQIEQKKAEDREKKNASPEAKANTDIEV